MDVVLDTDTTAQAVTLDLANLATLAAEADAVTDPNAGRMVDAGYWLTIMPAIVDAVIEGLFERGDKVAVIGKSKTRKSFLVLQLAFCLVLGIPFMGFCVGRRRRVLLIQLEIKADHMHRRVRNMAHALHVNSVDGLYIYNGRGAAIDQDAIIRWGLETKADVIIIDPIYKLAPSDESVEPMAAILRMFDAITEATGATVVYVHHDKKGASGDLDLVDRGSGSGVTGRDYDTGMFLTPHVDGEGVVVEFITRNHPPRGGVVARFEDGCFVVDDAATPQVETSRTHAVRRSKGASFAELADKAEDMFDVGETMQADQLRVRLQDQFGIGQHKARDVIRMLCERDGFETERTKEFQSKKIIKRVS
jgi:hypothetical protein